MDAAIVKGQPWPPTDADAYRVDLYNTLRDIVDGNHIAAFKDQDELERYKVYVTCNLAGLITRRATDLLFGEELTLQFEDDDPEEKTSAVTDWWYDNDIQKVLYEGSLDGAGLGDAVYLPSRKENGLVAIEPAQVQTWFPVLDPDNQRNVTAHIFAWERTYKGPQGDTKTLLKVKIHEKGSIRNELWELKNGNIGDQFKKGSAEWKAMWGTTPETEPTGIDDDFLVVHVPNYRSARAFFGTSDVFGLDALFSCLNARYSQLDHLLANHADPVMVDVPPEIVDPVTKGLNRKDLSYITASGDPAEKTPSYITWRGSPAETLQFIEEITNKILLISETDKALLGLDTGGGPTSGRALKYALMATLAKVNRKRQYYNQAIPKMIVLAQRLWGEKDPVYPSILWPDGLPQDTTELREEMSARLADRTMSRMEAIKRMDQADEKLAQKLLDEIDEEDSNTDEAVSKTIMGNRIPPQTVKPDMSDLGDLGSL